MKAQVSRDTENEKQAKAALQQANAALSKARAGGDAASTQIAAKAVRIATEAVQRGRQNLARDKAAGCQLKAAAEVQFPMVKQRVATDQQVIRNFGFQQQVAEIEAWGEMGEQARQAYQEKAQRVLTGVALDEIVGGLKAGISSSTEITEPLANKLVAMFRAAGIPQEDKAYSITRWVGTKLTPQRARTLNKGIDEVKEVYAKLSDSEDVANSGQVLDIAHSVLEVGGWFNPELGLLAKDSDTLSLAVYGTEYALAKHKIEKLTTITEAQLADLNSVTNRLKNDAVELDQLTSLLKSAQTCNSANLAGPRVPGSARAGLSDFVPLAGSLDICASDEPLDFGEIPPSWESRT